MSFFFFKNSSFDYHLFYKHNKIIIYNNSKLKNAHSYINNNNKKTIKMLIYYSIFILFINATLFLNFIKNIRFSYKIKKRKTKIYLFNNSSLSNMKHAILVLSSYGVDYLNNFLYQFNNDSRFDIYIHLEGKSLQDFHKGKNILKSNIKYCNHLYNSKRFSIGMVDAMYHIMAFAGSNYNYDFYHFFSESCYLVKSLDYIYNYFAKNNLYSYVNYFLNNKFLYNNQSHVLYKGSQWMSINRDIVIELLKRKKLFKKYKKEIKKGIIKIDYGAPDEFFFQHIIIKDICKETSKKCNVKNTNLRFIRWQNCEKKYCPNLLDISNVSNEEINYIRKNCLIIRKINYKNPKAIELINKIKSVEN